MSGSAQARWGLAVLLVALALLQPASGALGDYFLDHVVVATDTRQVWRAYLERPAPDVLLVGDSRVGSDVDPALLGRALSRAAGRPVRVGEISLGGSKPDLLAAVLERVLARPSRPRLVLLAVSEYQLNDSYRRDPTGDLWQITQ